MRIIKAKGKNFLSFGEFEYDYTAQGLTLIEGFDEDLDVNTGAGKSTFLDIISYGLFGTTSKNMKADEVINWNAKKDMEVEVTFEKGGETYTIKRYRKHKDHDNDFFIEKDGEQLRGKDARETQTLLEGITGYTFEIFSKATYFSQFDSIDRFLSASDKEKKELIGTICDLTSYDEMTDSVKERLKGDYEAKEDYEIKIKELKGKAEMLKTQIALNESKFNEWMISHNNNILIAEKNVSSFEQEKLAKIESKKALIARWEESKKEEIVKAEKLIEDWNNDKVFKINEITLKSESYANNLKELVEELKSDCAKLETQLNECRAKYSEKKVETLKIDGVKAEIATIKEKKQSLKKVEESIQSIKIELSVLESKKNELRQKIVSEQEKITKGSGDCPFCHQKVSAEHIKLHVDELTKKGLEYKAQTEELNQKMLPLNLELATGEELDKKLSELENQLSELSKVEWELRNLQSEGTRLKEAIESKQRRMAEATNQANPFTLELNAVKASICPYIQTLKTLKESINPHLESLSYAENEVNPYHAVLNDLKTKENPFGDMNSKILPELEGYTTELKSLEKKLKKVNEEISYGEFWKEALGVYIKSFLMDSFLEQLNVQANQYLETLFNGVLKVEINAVTEGKKTTKEKISQRIYNGNNECSYQSLSGGERCRVCLAINLALSDLTSKTMGETVSILMLDEIFNGLDSSGKTQTMRLLKELEPRFETIFVIDHTEEFKSLFTNNILIKKKGGFSRIN